MTTALCLGGAQCVREDWKAALELFTPDLVLACNHVGAIWPSRLDAWVTLHPDEITGWRDERRANGLPDADEHLVFGDRVPSWCSTVWHIFPGMSLSGSSGLMAAKVALCDLGADRVVVAGMPLDRIGHFYDDRVIFEAAGTYREAWQTIPPEYRARIRSMSGWTADYLGRPDKEWLQC